MFTILVILFVIAFILLVCSAIIPNKQMKNKAKFGYLVVFVAMGIVGYIGIQDKTYALLMICVSAISILRLGLFVKENRK